MICGENQLNGFWSAKPCFRFVARFKYDDEKLSLDKYTIVEQDRQRKIYNRLEYFTPEWLESEIRAARLEFDELYGDAAGISYAQDAAEFAVVLKRR